MAKQETGTGLKQEDFSKIFDEYRARIEEITRRAEKNLRPHEAAPDSAVTDVSERTEVVTPPPEPVNTRPPLQPEPVSPPPEEPAVKTRPIVDRDKQVIIAPRESEKILNEARREASKIIEKAEENCKKEAKKRTQALEEKIIEKARKDAGEIMAQANRDAEKMRGDVIAESKQEAGRVIRDITEKYRRETEAQASRVAAEAKDKADKMLADISASTVEVTRLITDLAGRAKNTVGELETDLQVKAADLTRIVDEARARFEAASQTAKEERPESLPTPPGPPLEPGDSPTLDIRLTGEKSRSNNGTAFLFRGQMEMTSVSESFDYQYLKRLKKHLTHIPNIKYLQESASEKEMSVLFEVLQPLPVLDILKNVPMVVELVRQTDDDIRLVFENSG